MCEEACFVKPGPGWLPRLMVVDGCNVGRSACGVGREAVDCAGLMAVIRWLLIRDFDVVAFLPVVYNNSHNFNAVHVHLLGKLEELGLVTFTPARTGRGDRKAFINYDDLYVTTLAARHGGCVLSGDKFKDILAQSAYSEFYHVILHRTLDVKFRFLPHEIVHHDADVFYKALPELFIYEDISVRAQVIAEKIFASPDDPEYSKVLLRRETWSEKRKEERISAIDDMFAELCEMHAIRPLALENLPGYHFQMLSDPLDEFEQFDGVESILADQYTFNHNNQDHGDHLGLVDELWIDSPASSTNSSETCDERALLQFNESTAHFESSFPSNCPRRQLTNTFEASQLEMNNHTWKSSDTLDSELPNRYRESVAYSTQNENKPLMTAYSQEDVLQEIVAHIDTLLTARDKMSKKETNTDLQTGVAELVSFNHIETKSIEEDCFREDSVGDNTSERSLEGSTSGSSSLPMHAFLEEEISYDNNRRNEDSNCRDIITDSEIEEKLSSIFPVDIVQQVLTVNASRNLAFLADQCAELCFCSTDY
ncbi:hypothetical protein RB195_007155 [Necator americanus]